MSGQSDPLGSVQEIEISPCKRMVYALLEMRPRKKDAQPLWDFQIQIDHLISARRTDLLTVNKKQRTCRIVDFAVPADYQVKSKEGKN